MASSERQLCHESCDHFARAISATRIHNDPKRYLDSAFKWPSSLPFLVKLSEFWGHSGQHNLQYTQCHFEGLLSLLSPRPKVWWWRWTVPTRPGQASTVLSVRCLTMYGHSDTMQHAIKGCAPAADPGMLVRQHFAALVLQGCCCCCCWDALLLLVLVPVQLLQLLPYALGNVPKQQITT